MPLALAELSTNVRESETSGRKRSHDEYASELTSVEESCDTKPSASSPSQSNVLPVHSRASSELSDLTEPGSITPPRKSPSPETSTEHDDTKASESLSMKTATGTKSTQPTTANAPVKRKKLTTAEKEARDKEIAEQKEKKAAEKEAREKDLAEQKKQREEKAAIRAAEKAKAEEEKAARAQEREDKKRKKEDEKKRIQEEKDKKARSQQTLGSFFKIPLTPKKTDSTTPKNESIGHGSPIKTATQNSKTEYEKLFQSFFVKENTKLAVLTPFMDEETREVKSRILDECVAGKRASELEQKAFDPVKLFALPGKPPERGRLHHPVKHIMEHAYKEAEKPGGSDPDHANRTLKETRERLAKIPVKVIAFSQDVRPPYYGTMTFKPFALGKGNMSQLARNPTGRRLPLEYDYDSEAEWQEEEGEDLDMEDDEEELDDEDDMDGFLDDTEDVGLSRGIFANTMEPESTGLCYEDKGPLDPGHVVYEHRMEFMHDGLEQTWGIDPFSTQYWEPETKLKPSKATGSDTKMPPPPAPANAFAALTGTDNSAGEIPKLVKSELLDDVKKSILEHKALSKVGIVDFIFNQFRDSVSRAEVKNTIELVAEKKGQGRTKMWALKPGHEMAS